MDHFASQRSKHWFRRTCSRPAAAAGHGVQLAELPRRGLLLPQGRAHEHGARVLSTDAGREAYELMERLFPLCRSLTGDGVRATFDVSRRRSRSRGRRSRAAPGFRLDRARRVEPPRRHVTAPDGTRVVDYRDSTLHVVSYSEPVRTTAPLDELRERLHTLPEQPDVVPYRTSYYERTWGLSRTPTAARVQAGRLRGGDRFHPRAGPPLTPSTGSRAKERRCWSRPTSATPRWPTTTSRDRRRDDARKALLERRLRHTYRFLFAPGTIGPLAWLHQNREG